MNMAGIASTAKKLMLISDTLGLLDLARTKLAATENEQLKDIAGEIEQLCIKILKTVREVLPE